MKHKEITDNAELSSLEIVKKYNLENEKVKFTFTSNGQLLIVDEKKVSLEKLPKHFHRTRIKTISPATVLKKGIEETKVTVLLEDKVQEKA